MRLCQLMPTASTAAFSSPVSTATMSPLAFHHALLTGKGTAARLRLGLAAAGGDDQVQSVCKVIMAHPGLPGYTLVTSPRSSHYLLWLLLPRYGFTAEGHTSGNLVPQAMPCRHNEHIPAGSVM